MVSFGLILALILEVAAVALLCFASWSVRFFGVPWGKILVAVVLAIVAVRVIAVVVAFVLSWVWRSPRAPEQWIGFGKMLAMVLGEILAVLLVRALLVPFARPLVKRRRGTVRSAKQPPVLFIHSYAANAGIWAPLIEYLSAHGLSRLYTLNLLPKHGDLDDFAQQLAARVNRICETARSETIILVGHGMGGLVARCYIERCGGHDRVAKLITIGTSHHGTMLARFVPVHTLRQMRPQAPWIAELNREESWHADIDYVSVYSVHDNAVMPQATAELVTGRNIEMTGLGHFSLLFSQAVGQVLYREISAS